MNRRTPRPEDAAPGGPPPVSVLYVNDNVPLRNQIEELNSELLLLTTATAPPTEQKTTPTDTAQRTTTYKTSAVITRPDTHFTCPNKRQKSQKRGHQKHQLQETHPSKQSPQRPTQHQLGAIGSNWQPSPPGCRNRSKVANLQRRLSHSQAAAIQR